ncbi:MAG: hypothetical protein ABH879_03070 [archaeon]
MRAAMKIVPYLIAAAELVSCAPGIQMGRRSPFSGTHELIAVKDRHGNEGYSARIAKTPYGAAGYHRIAAVAEIVAKERARHIEQILREQRLGIEALAEADTDNNFRIDAQEYVAFMAPYLTD